MKTILHSAEARKNSRSLPSVFVLLLSILLAGLTAITAFAQNKERPVQKQVEQFLREYYKIFEMSVQDPDGALKRASSGLTEDFTAIFYIPGQKKELLHFDKKTIVDGFSQAFSLYAGKKPVMKISKVIVLRRNETEAVAFFQMDFYLEGSLKNQALSIADLRYEDGSWKMYRQYENKEK